MLAKDLFLRACALAHATLRHFLPRPSLPAVRVTDAPGALRVLCCVSLQRRPHVHEIGYGVFLSLVRYMCRAPLSGSALRSLAVPDFL